MPHNRHEDSPHRASHALAKPFVSSAALAVYDSVLIKQTLGRSDLRTHYLATNGPHKTRQLPCNSDPDLHF